jgi:chromosome partitioning protein
VIIAVINQKGGVAKTTTTGALSAGLKSRGNNVLAIDLDPQGNLSYAMRVENNNLSSYSLLVGQTPVMDVIQHTEVGNIIPASPLLSRTDIELDMVGKEYKLKEVLADVNYDFILIDTPPALSILTVNALAAADEVIIPAQADVFSLQGIGQLYNTIDTVKKYCNPNLKIKGILLTRHNNRAIINRDLTETLAQTAAQLKTKIFKTVIRENITIKEAHASRQDIFTYDSKSNAAHDYNKFINELLESEDTNNA